MKSLFLVLLLLSGCGKIGSNTQCPEPTPYVVYKWIDKAYVRDIPPQVLPYVESFEINALFYGKTIPNYNIVIMIQSDENFPGNLIGLCQNYNGSAPVITLKYSYWVNSNETQKLWLVYHELDHCWLHYAHTSGDIHNIMNPQINASPEETQIYIEKLFTESYPRLEMGQ